MANKAMEAFTEQAEYLRVISQAAELDRRSPEFQVHCMAAGRRLEDVPGVTVKLNHEEATKMMSILAASLFLTSMRTKFVDIISGAVETARVNQSSKPYTWLDVTIVCVKA